MSLRGYKVTWIVNITDVDDKLIEKANELGVPMRDLAEKHTKEYFKNPSPPAPQRHPRGTRCPIS